MSEKDAAINKDLFFDERYNEELAIADAIRESKPNASEIKVRVPGFYLVEEVDEYGCIYEDEVSEGYKDGHGYLYKKYLLNDKGEYVPQPRFSDEIKKLNSNILHKLKKSPYINENLLFIYAEDGCYVENVESELIETTSGEKYFCEKVTRTKTEKDEHECDYKVITHNLKECQKGHLIDVYSTDKGKKIPLPHSGNVLYRYLVNDLYKNNPELCLRVNDVKIIDAVILGEESDSCGYKLKDDRGNSYFVRYENYGHDFGIYETEAFKDIPETVFSVCKIKNTDKILCSTSYWESDYRHDCSCYPYNGGFIVTDYVNKYNDPDQDACRSAIEITKEGQVIKRDKTISNVYNDGTILHYTPGYIGQHSSPSGKWLEKDGFTTSTAREIIYNENNQSALVLKYNPYFSDYKEGSIAIFSKDNGFDENVSCSVKKRDTGIIEMGISRETEGTEPEYLQMIFFVSSIDDIFNTPKFEAFLKDLRDNPEIAFQRAQKREIKDSLQLKMEVARAKLGSKIGKTGDSSTGEVTSEHRNIARKQTDISKHIMTLKKEKDGK